MEYAFRIREDLNSIQSENQYNIIVRFFEQLCKSNKWELSSIAKYKPGKLYKLVNCGATIDYHRRCEIMDISDDKQYLEQNNIHVFDSFSFFETNYLELGDIVSHKYSNYFGKITRIRMGGWFVSYQVTHGDMTVELKSNTLIRVN